MKKTFYFLAVLLGVLSVTITSCNKDDDGDGIPDAPEYSGTYQVYMDGDKVAEGTSEEIGLVADVITIGEVDDISMIISGVPVTVGESVDIDGTNYTVVIMGKNLIKTDGSDEMYFASDGTITRTSSTKVSIEGNCAELMGTTTYTFSGYAESDVYKNIEEAK